MSQKYLVVGLGNYGKEYENTRHNAGFMVLEKIASDLGLEFRMEKKFRGKIIQDHEVTYLKPETYMNNSGISVSALISYYNINPENIVLIYDDVDLPLGTIRIRNSGSSGGHKGVQSVIDSLGNPNFIRIRIGIDTEKRRIPTEAFVLKNFSKEEMASMEKIIKEVTGELKGIVNSENNQEINITKTVN